MLHTIVVPLDGSLPAERALPYARLLARATGSKLMLVHARRCITPDEDLPDLEAVAERLRAAEIDVDVRLCHLPSPEEAGQAILDASRDLNADLVVMSTHGRSGLGRVLYGSVADQILRRTHLPLLLIPARCERAWHDGRSLRVLAPLDGSAFSEAILAPLEDLIGPLLESLILLRTPDSIDYAGPHDDRCDVCRLARARGEEPDIEPVRVRRELERVAARLRVKGIDTESNVELGATAPTILRIAHERDIDLIAMATHGHGGLTRLVMGSVATDVLRRATTPLLVIRPVATESVPTTVSSSDEIV